MLQGDEAASFTKEEMQQGKHTDYEKQLHEEMLSGLANSNPVSSQPPPPEPQDPPPGKKNDYAVHGGVHIVKFSERKRAWYTYINIPLLIHTVILHQIFIGN